METFVRVVEKGNLSAAARGLGLSLAAVSRQVSSLERDLGAPLLIRTTRQVALTDAGRRFYERCVRLLVDVDEAEAAVRAERAIEGRVTLSTSVTIGALRVGPMVPGLLAKHPGLRIDLRLEDHYVDFVAEGVDIVLRAGTTPPNSTSVIARPVASWGRVVVASPRYLKARGVPKDVAELAHHATIAQLPAGEIGTQWRFVRGGEEQVIEIGAAYRANAPLAQRDAALAGLGIALLPDWVAEDAIRRGDLRVLLSDYEGPRVELLAVHRVELRNVPRVRAVIDYICAAWRKG
jgi:DNA-binding transcriptional LysR family regulator